MAMNFLHTITFDSFCSVTILCLSLDLAASIRLTDQAFVGCDGG